MSALLPFKNNILKLKMPLIVCIQDAESTGLLFPLGAYLPLLSVALLLRKPPNTFMKSVNCSTLSLTRDEHLDAGPFERVDLSTVATDRYHHTDTGQALSVTEGACIERE